MHDIGIDYPLRDWCDFRVPKTTHKPNFIKKSLNNNVGLDKLINKEMIWIGGTPELKNINNKLSIITIHNRTDFVEITFSSHIAKIVYETINKCSVRNKNEDENTINTEELKKNERYKFYLSDLKSELQKFGLITDFNNFCAQESMQDLFDTGLLLI